MRITSTAAALGLLIAGVAAPAQAATTRDLYMVRDLKQMDGFYIGEFAVVRKDGRSLRGAVGAFASEYSCVSGRLTAGIFRGTVTGMDGQPPAKFKRAWLGTGSKQRFKGFTSVSRSEFLTYSDGFAPEKPLRYCLRNS